MIEIHRDWEGPQRELAPAAPHTGPFASRALLRAWWELRAPEAARLALVTGDEGAVPLWEGPDGVQFLGEEDLIDYHAPLGAGIPELVAAYFEALPAGTRFRLDSMPEEAAELVAKGLREIGVAADPARHEATAVVDLPPAFDDYLQMIGKKERHEMRRKRRRFQRLLGDITVESSADGDALAHFVGLHRMAAGPKGDFMTDGMAEFFGVVLEQVPGARIDLLISTAHGAPVAATFGFESDGGYYLYNSAYDPAAADASPGIVLLGALLEALTESGFRRFDFLKGDEAYKFRLGAVARPLFVIEGTR